MIAFDNKTNFSYEMIGEFRSTGRWIHPRRWINSIEAILVLEGEVHIAEEGEEYSLYPNDIIILEPHKEHYGFKETLIPTAFYWFHFHTDIPLPFKVCKGAEVYDVKRQLKRLLHITNTADYSSFSADAAGFIAFEEFCRLQSSTASSNSVLVSNIKEYIRGNIKNDVSVSEISEHFGYNPDYIGKLFKNTVGMGLKEFIVSGRMKRAKDALLTTSKTVKQISAEQGFADENLFAKFFLYHEGCSPTTYRKKYCNTHINSK